MLVYNEIKDSLNESLAGQNEDPVLVDCGLISYKEALDLQFSLQQAVTEKEIPNTVLFLEHPPVITTGARKHDNRLLSSEESMKAAGIHLEPIRRAGGATSHNPGQLVLYPIYNLRSLGFRVVPYVEYLEQIGIDLAASYGIKCQRKKGFPGLWTSETRKIASIGVQINVGVTMHGIAINLDNDLSIFSHIIPCGLDGVYMTSVARELGSEEPVDMGTAKERAAEYVRSHLPRNDSRFSRSRI